MERADVRERLLGAAAEHFTRYGYRRASIADVARAVGIGKGTLYLFFASKAELFVGVVLRVEQRMRARLVEEMRKPYPSARDRLRRFFRLQAEALAEQPVLAVMVNPEEAAALMRDLPADAMEELRVSDERFYSGLAEQWQREGALAPIAPEVLAALPRALFALTLQRSLIGDEVFPRVLDLVIESLTDTLLPREGRDG